MGKRFYITNPRFLQQEGQSEPQYVHASAGYPVLVTLPDDFEPSKHDLHIHHHTKPPAKPKHTSPGAGRGSTVQSNAARQGKPEGGDKAESGGAALGVRASDSK